MSQIYIIFIEVMENGDNDDIFMKKKRKKNNEDTSCWDTDIYISHLYLSLVSIHKEGEFSSWMQSMRA